MSITPDVSDLARRLQGRRPDQLSADERWVLELVSVTPPLGFDGIEPSAAEAPANRMTIGADEHTAHRVSTREAPDPAEQPLERSSLISGSKTDGSDAQNRRIDRSTRPGWATGAECVPEVGDEVLCTAGPGTVLRLLGKTGNGSRLIELRLRGAGRETFFAAGSNVLIPPRNDNAGAAPTI